MAVTFTSNGYDTTTGNPYTEVAWADAHPSIGSARYGVRSPSDWKVSAVAGADRTVSINAGSGFGHGVTDKTVANETIQLDPIASGSRWDLIAVRRDWTPTAGESKFVKINGGSTMVLPGGRQIGPGNIDDQPLALVMVTAGQTQPQLIIDLRVWAGDGGGLVGAHDLVRSYLNSTGTRVNIWGQDWIRNLADNDVPQWKRLDLAAATKNGLVSPAGYSVDGNVYVEPMDGRTRVTADFTIKRTGSSFTVGSDFTGFGAILPDAARGVSPDKYFAVAMSGGSGGNNIHATVFVNTSTGVVMIRSQDPFSWTTGALFSLNFTYFI